MADRHGRPPAATASARFDPSRFAAALHTRELGRRLRAVERTGSTNDDAWAALAGEGHGVAVVAAVQERGRGRGGHAWTQVAGCGLAMSVGLYTRTGVRPGGLLPLAAGLAAARAAQALGLREARLKWPNDVLVRGRKLAGLLCESRFTSEGDAVVVGIGMNVAHGASDFPPALRERATSLALAGVTTTIEQAAAAFLDELEPLWERIGEGDAAPILTGWAGLCDDWGRAMRARAPGGDIEGVAVRLAPDGALVLETPAGEQRIVAGDVEPIAGAGA